MANQVTYGFVNLRDVFGRKVTDVGVSVVQAAIAATIAQHNREMDALLNLFVRRTTDFRAMYRTIGTARLQPLDENGRALPIKGGAVYQLEWPLHRAGSAWGKDYETNIKMTVEHVNEQTELMLDADRVWLRDHILAALFFSTNPGWTFDDEEKGNLTIVGLANSDAQTYSLRSGAPNATATHYLAQAATVADATNPYPTAQTLLESYPDNSGTVINLVPTNLIAATRGLATFHSTPDPNLRIPNTETVLVGTLGVSVPGIVRGYVDSGGWIVEWPSLPSNYIVSLMTGGERPLSLREDEESSLRGFNQVATREDFPYTEFQYRRKAGFGAWNRIGAVVTRTGNGTYAIPTNYGSPMP